MVRRLELAPNLMCTIQNFRNFGCAPFKTQIDRSIIGSLTLFDLFGQQSLNFLFIFTFYFFLNSNFRWAVFVILLLVHLQFPSSFLVRCFFVTIWVLVSIVRSIIGCFVFFIFLPLFLCTAIGCVLVFQMLKK
jgi:hypothetical protein